AVDPALLRVELRTPLNAVVGYTEILLEAAAEAEQPALGLDLEKIHTAAKHLLGLIDYLLDFSRDAADAPPVGAARLGTAPTGAVDGRGARQGVSPGLPGLEGDPAAAPRVEHGALLVVDDNALNRDVLARRLQRIGYTVATAEHGRQALEML